MTERNKATGLPYKVGYKKPPAANQFKKGQSGNKNGRPKGSLNLTTLIAKSLAQKVTVTEGGRTKQITKAEAGAKNLANLYAKGDMRAVAHVHNIHGWMTVDETPAELHVESDEVLLRNVVNRLVPEPTRKINKPSDPSVRKTKAPKEQT